MKEALFLGIFICSAYLGFSFGDKYQKRYGNLKVLEKALILMKNQILFVYTPLPEVFENTGDKIEGPWKKVFKDIGAILNNNFVDDVYGAFKDSINRYANILYIENEDRDLILDFSKSLGESGVYGQEQIFNLTINNLENIIEEARDLRDKNCKMYRYLGVCLGVMIIIFLI